MGLSSGVGDDSLPRVGFSFNLSATEKECIEQFLSCSGTAYSNWDSYFQAFHFLAARKFSVPNALELYRSCEAFIKAEGVNIIDPFDESVRRELLSGKFTILNDNELAGARVAQFFVRLHRPARSTHKAFLQSVIFQLCAVLRKETAVRNGIILIYDMTNSKYSNFDLDLSKKLFNLLNTCYPIRLRRIIILRAPLWFRAPFQLLRVFVSEELRDRVHVLRPTPGSRLAALSNPDPEVAQKEHFTWLRNALVETNTPICLNRLSAPQAASAQQAPEEAVTAFFDTSNIALTGRSACSTLDRLSGRSSSSASETGEELSGMPASAGEDSLMSELGCCSPNWDPFALSSSQSSDAESNGIEVGAVAGGGGGTRNDMMSMSCSPVISTAAHCAVTASTTNGFCKNGGPGTAAEDRDQNLRDPSGTPTPPAIPKSSARINGGGGQIVLAMTPTANTASSAYILRASPSGIAPLASQDEDFVPTPTSKVVDGSMVHSSNTIRKERYCKRTIPAAAATSPSSSKSGSLCSLGGRTIVRPSELIPPWALNRPSGDSIHLGPQDKHSSGGGTSIGDPQPDRFYCSGEPSLPPTISPRTLRHSIIQSPLTQPESELRNDKAPGFGHFDGELERENGEASEEEGMEGEEEGDYYDDDDDDEDDSEGDETMELDLDSLWMTADQLVAHVADLGIGGLVEEYAAVCSMKTEDPCTAFRQPCNAGKNRYVDVKCLEHSRVQLRSNQQQASGTHESGVGKTSSRAEKQAPIYIHANWVDSYRQRNAFICTQGPLQETAGDFWCMMWTYHVPAIVMITRCYESQRCKCFQYWPAVEGQSLRFTSIANTVGCGTTSGNTASVVTACVGHSGTLSCGKKKPLYGLARRSASEVSNSTKLIYEVTNVATRAGEDYTHTRLQLKDLRSGQSRFVDHYGFHSWPDHGVPSDSSALLELLERVQTDYSKTIHRELSYTSSYDIPIPPPPIVVHCSAGIGRTGTFIALDVSTKQLMELGQVNVPLTVSRIRSQRAGCVQVSAQYVFVYRALLDFALSRGLISQSEPAGEAPGVVAAALQRLSAPPMRPLLPTLPPSVAAVDATALLSALAATNAGADNSVGEAANFGALLRLLRSGMISVRSAIDPAGSDSRISTELDYESEETQLRRHKREASDDEAEIPEVTADEEEEAVAASALNHDKPSESAASADRATADPSSDVEMPHAMASMEGSPIF